MAWKPVEDHKIRHRWVHPDLGEPECVGDKEVYVSPAFYADAGTPCCGECGADFEYVGTEIEASEEEIVMALCEAPRVLLKPDVHYRFVVMKGCSECAKAGQEAEPCCADAMEPREEDDGIEYHKRNGDSCENCRKYGETSCGKDTKNLRCWEGDGGG